MWPRESIQHLPYLTWQRFWPSCTQKKMDSKRDHHRLLHQTSLVFLDGHQVDLPSTNIDSTFREQGVHKH